MPRPKSNRQTEGIRRMVHQHLRRRALVAPPFAADTHLDEDALSAFTEGRLSEQESAPVVRHLVACSFCRHITAQLVRLDSEVGESSAASAAPMPEEPGRIRRLLDSLAERVFTSHDDDAVFAYHAPAEDFEKDEDKESSKESSDDTEEKH
ncbi:MAG: hypothetical protein JOZ52_00135 [Acidobacteria bacterium]|nr:hypothetical protein [Acidobacteriota bacterium]